MRAKVINNQESVIYKDQIYKFGDEFEIDEVIGKSLVERGYIAVMTDNAELFNEDEVMEVPADEVEEKDLFAEVEEESKEAQEGIEIREVESMSYPELKAYASVLGLSASGKKDELIARINEHLEGLDEAEADELPNTDMPE